MTYYIVSQPLYWATIIAVIAMGVMCIGLFIIAGLLNRKPVEEPRHGKWVWIGEESPMCNICGTVFSRDDNADAGTWKHCPNCGEQMDGE